MIDDINVIKKELKNAKVEIYEEDNVEIAKIA